MTSHITIEEVEQRLNRIHNGYDPISVARALQIPECFAAQQRTVVRAGGKYYVSVPGQEFCLPLGRTLTEAAEALDDIRL